MTHTLVHRMKTTRVILRVLAVILTLFFGTNLLAWITPTPTIGIGAVLWTALTVGAAGLMFEQEWARRTVLIGTAVWFVLDIVSMAFWGRAVDFQSLSYGLFAAVLFGFYMVPLIRSFYVRRRQDPHQVLVIDDDRGFLRLVQANLFKRGIAVLIAETGEKGLTLAAKYRPDLIFLDVILPGIKGRAVCAKLKEDPSTRDIPVVFLTAKNSPDDVQAEMEIGAVSHLTKPVNFQDLYAEIDKRLGAA